jgi:hypothetical protein
MTETSFAVPPPLTLKVTSVVIKVDPAWLGAANARLASAAKARVKKNDRLLILPP